MNQQLIDDFLAEARFTDCCAVIPIRGHKVRQYFESIGFEARFAKAIAGLRQRPNCALLIRGDYPPNGEETKQSYTAQLELNDSGKIRAFLLLIVPQEGHEVCAVQIADRLTNIIQAGLHE